MFIQLSVNISLSPEIGPPGKQRKWYIDGKQWVAIGDILGTED